MGIDVVYIAANPAMQESDDTTLIDGVPTLAVEVLATGLFGDIWEKRALYQRFGVALVWVIDPHGRAVTI